MFIYKITPVCAIITQASHCIFFRDIKNSQNSGHCKEINFPIMWTIKFIHLIQWQWSQMQGLIEELSLYVWYTIHDCPLQVVPRCTDDLKWPIDTMDITVRYGSVQYLLTELLPRPRTYSWHCPYWTLDIIPYWKSGKFRITKVRHIYQSHRVSFPYFSFKIFE